MAGVTKTLTFAEGVETTGPTTTFLQTTQFAVYADDAAFVTNKGSAASDGDAYYNSTTDVIKVYADGSWQSVFDDSDSNVALLTGTQTFSGAKTFSAAVNISDTTQSTDKDTGALIVEGGIGVEKNMNVGGNAEITGDLTVQGTTTTINTETLDVEDANVTVNKNGNEATADSNDAGLTVDMSDATNALIHYDSTATSKWKAGALGSTKEVVTLSDIQQLTNKDYDGGTASNTLRITLPKNTTSNLTGLTRKEGTIVYDTTLKKPYYDDGTNLNEIGGGAGGINYIENSDAEGGIIGWDEFDDSTDYIDGTGSTAANLELTQNTSSPLRGNADFDLVVAAANAQYEGISTDFTIDKADKYSMLSISFDYLTNAPDDFFAVRIYDVTNTEVIYCVPEDIKASTVENKFTAQFQTTDSTSYRLSIFVNSSSASGYTINFDNVVVGPEQTEIESVPVIFSAERNISSQTITAGSNVDIEFNSIFEDSRNAYDGTDTYTFPESGYYKISGTICCICGATAPNYIRVVLNSTSLVYQDDLTNGKGVLIPYSYTKYFNHGDTAILKFYCDAQNVSLYTSGTNISIEKTGGSVSGGGNAVVALIVERNDGQTMIDNTIDVVEFNTVKSDTAGIYNSSTGEATIPSSGYYQANAQVTFSSANLDVDEYIQTWIYKNGNSLTNNATTLDSSDGGTPYKCSLVSRLFYFEKGDVVDVRFRQNSGTDSATYVYDGVTFFTLHKISNSEQVFSSEKVALISSKASPTLISGTIAAGDALFSFDKIKDTHNAYDTATGKFTCPSSGLYRTRYVGRLTGSGTGGYYTSKILQTGSVARTYVQSFVPEGQAQTNNNSFMVESIFDAAKGDLIYPNLECNFTSGALTSDVTGNYFLIEKL